MESGGSFYRMMMMSWIEFPDIIIKNRRIGLILKYGFLLLSVAILMLILFTGYSFSKVTILTILLVLFFTALLLTSRYYDWPYILFLMVFIGLYYKKLHWPYSAGFLTAGTVLLATLCWYNAIKFLYTFRHNSFLKWFGSTSSIIILFFMMGFLWMNQHWPGSAILIGFGSFIFVLTVVALTFILPFSNYVSWPDLDRKVFFRTVLIPMVFIFMLFTLIYVFPDLYNSITGRGIKFTPWPLDDLQLFKLDSI